LLAAPAVAAGITLAPCATALAAWTAAGSGAAAATAAVMPAGLAPTAAATGDVVSLRWTAATFPDGTAVAGYTVTRTNAAGTTSAAGGSCSGIVSTTTCTDSPVPPGTWTYTDTPVLLSWTGAQSPPSNAVTVPLT
jgi:hypothetical protein